MPEEAVSLGVPGTREVEPVLGSLPARNGDGAARTGVAISDASWTLARPLGVVRKAASEAGLAEVGRLVTDEDVELVVVGLPVGLSGEEGTQAGLARAFCHEVARLVEVPVDTYDERLTTRLAQRTARAGASAAEDSIAAAHLLESFLASRDAEERP